MGKHIKGIGEAMNKTILCIDDVKEIRDLLCDYLNMLGYNVVTAEDGEEGLKKALEERPDLIFLDIMMPRKNGYAVLKELKSNANLCDIPVIVVSVQSGMEDMCQLEGAEHFFSKGFRLKDIAQAVEKVLDEKNLAKQL